MGGLSFCRSMWRCSKWARTKCTGTWERDEHAFARRAHISLAVLAHTMCLRLQLNASPTMTVATTAPHPLQLQWRCRELLRLRSSSDRLRYGAAIRAGRIDPNPHQIEAVRFALDRL